MAHDDTPKKPEWFEMAESDVNPADYIEETSSLKTSKRLPIIALLATGAILAGGSVFANVTQEQPANADNVAAAPATQSANNVDPNSNTSTPAAQPTTAGMTAPTEKHAPNGVKPPANSNGGQIAVPGQGPRHHENGDGDHPFPPRGHHDDNENDDEGSDD